MKQYTILTANGINKLLKTASNGSKIILKEVVVSDFDGELSESITTIPNEKYRGAINAITINESDSNILDVDAIIPPDVGGFYIKTAGIFCDDGSLFAVARLADTYKPLLSEGSSKDITLSFRLQIANANDSIVLKVDNNVVLATRKWSDATFLKKTDKIDAYTKRESDDKFALKTELTDGLPIGAYLSYPSQKVIPAGFLIADGRSLKKSEYAELFNVLGYVYGGSGENFNLPNFSDGKFMRSIGGNAAQLGVVQQDEIKSHSHSIGQQPGVGQSNNGGTGGFVGQNSYMQSGVTGGNETRPYNMAVVIIIKAKNVNTPAAGQIDKTILATETKAGITKLKNSITAQQEDVAVTERAVREFVNNSQNGIGVGQTYKKVWDQRDLNTYYPNTTNKPILVCVSIEANNTDIPVSVIVDEVMVLTADLDNYTNYSFSFIVPAGSKYKLATLTNPSYKKRDLLTEINNEKLNTWSELS
ncbi:phage tail protein [Campylobacter concisus]|uniref:Putative tail fiber-related protein n=1 Tax=Campylobacter concisus ATCC 51562 TaxID=1242969 RepID=U2ES32_9BACT|nr:phage tail protein [Campylobacter concisus]ERJ26926.1 putative tail fiber-related protein [Campylobacter concisus ATCC 51562]